MKEPFPPAHPPARRLVLGCRRELQSVGFQGERSNPPPPRNAGSLGGPSQALSGSQWLWCQCPPSPEPPPPVSMGAESESKQQSLSPHPPSPPLCHSPPSPFPTSQQPGQAPEKALGPRCPQRGTFLRGAGKGGGRGGVLAWPSRCASLCLPPTRRVPRWEHRPSGTPPLGTGRSGPGRLLAVRQVFSGTVPSASGFLWGQWP